MTALDFIKNCIAANRFTVQSIYFSRYLVNHIVRKISIKHRYCEKAKKLFKDHEIEPYVIELDKNTQGSFIQDQLFDLTQQRTVPNIFIDGITYNHFIKANILEDPKTLKNILKIAKARIFCCMQKFIGVIKKYLTDSRYKVLQTRLKREHPYSDIGRLFPKFRKVSKFSSC